MTIYLKVFKMELICSWAQQQLPIEKYMFTIRPYLRPELNIKIYKKPQPVNFTFSEQDIMNIHVITITCSIKNWSHIYAV